MTIKSESAHSAAGMVDLTRYPIENIASGEGEALAQQCRREYNETGLCMLPGFIKDEALEKLATEAESMKSDAYFCKSKHNAYLGDGEDGASTAASRMEETYVGSVPYDRICADAQLNQLYLWDPLKDFIGFVLGKSSFYRFADPFGACSINVFVDGGEHGWHFDESEYTVTLMLQKPEEGGSFEYVPRIRGLADEETIVESVLSGARERVVDLPFTAGTLLIFGGQQTLHRVTRVSGLRSRLVPVLCYSEAPNESNSEAVRKLFWGRSGPDQTHVEA